MKKRIFTIFIALMSLTLTACSSLKCISDLSEETNIIIYQHPNEMSDAIFINPKEEDVTLIRKYHEDWQKVSIMETDGFMKENHNFTPKGKAVSLYANSDENSSVIRNIPEGTELPITATETTEWIRTFYDGTFGYVKSQELTFDVTAGSITVEQEEDSLTTDTENEKIIIDEKDKEKKDVPIKKTSSKQSIVFGIDVSHLNNKFSSPQDMIKYMRDNNISFAYIRCGGRGYGTEGNIYEDKRWKQYVLACEEAAIPYGLYYYSTAINKQEAQEEASYILNCLNQISNNKYNTIPIAIDVEQRRESRTEPYLTTGLLRDMAQIIIDELTEQNQNVVIYSDVSTYEDALLFECKDCDFWLAQLTENKDEYMRLKLKKKPKYGSIVAQQIEFGEQNGEGVDYDVAPASFII